MEIKKAFEQFKKELKKETGIAGGFTMNAKQIENRTATYCVGRTESYEATIKEFSDWKNRTNDACIIKECERRIAYFTEKRNQYGTRENENRTMIEQVINSKAYKKFCETVGAVKFNKEVRTTDGVDFLYIRFHY